MLKNTVAHIVDFIYNDRTASHQRLYTGEHTHTHNNMTNKKAHAHKCVHMHRGYKHALQE